MPVPSGNFIATMKIKLHVNLKVASLIKEDNSVIWINTSVLYLNLGILESKEKFLFLCCFETHWHERIVLFFFILLDIKKISSSL